MLLLGNDFLASHAASIQLAADSAEGSITLDAPSAAARASEVNVPNDSTPRTFRVSTSPITAYHASATCALVSTPSTNPITTDFFRSAAAHETGASLVPEPLFNTADEFAAKAPASCGSEYLLYTQDAVTIPACESEQQRAGLGLGVGGGHGDG